MQANVNPCAQQRFETALHQMFENSCREHY